MKKVTKPYKGLNTDVSPIDQPEGTYRYAKNAVMETTEGDKYKLSTELSTEACASIPEGFVFVGSEYMRDNLTAIFLTNGEESIIATLDKNYNYKEYVRNSCLGFNINDRIDATYRLRLGCEDTIYFVQEGQVPREFNFTNAEDYKGFDGEWDCDKFSLQNTVKEIPCITNIEVINGGNIPSGTVNFGIQLLDEDLNPTHTLAHTNTIKLYKSSIIGEYDNITGSLNKATKDETVSTLFGEGPTSKAIKFSVTNLDQSYSFYRVIVVKAITGTGIISTPMASPPIPLTQTEYTYTGSENGYTEVTMDEFIQGANYISSAEHIEQLENRLILANTQGSKYNFCDWQKAASKIKVNYTSKEISATKAVNGNDKGPTTAIDSMTFLADEVYALGIVYVSDEGESPPFHIPGRYIKDTERTKILTWSENIAHLYPNEEEYNSLPDSQKLEKWEIENTSSKPDKDGKGEMGAYEITSSVYEQNSCKDIWGRDATGRKLKNTPIRHHRMPSRENLPIISYTGTDKNIVKNDIYLEFTLNCEECEFPADEVRYTLTYTLNGTVNVLDKILYKEQLENQDAVFSVLVASDLDPEQYDIGNFVISGDILDHSEITWEFLEVQNSVLEEEDKYLTLIGLDFTNIEYPHPSIIGHYIVVGQRDEENRTIYDNGLSNNLRESDNFIGHCYMDNTVLGREIPRLTGEVEDSAFDNFEKVVERADLVYAYSPRSLFLRKEISADYMTINGVYTPDVFFPQFTREEVQDVAPGTTSRGILFGWVKTDKDGYSYRDATRWNNYSYRKTKQSNYAITDSVKLNPGERTTSFSNKQTINCMLDNVVELLELSSGTPKYNGHYNVNYVSFRKFGDVHPYLDNIQYRKVSQCLQYGDSYNIYGGDCYISKFETASSTYYGMESPKRVLEFIVDLAVLAAVTIVTAGAAGAAVGAAGLAGAGTIFGITITSAMVTSITVASVVLMGLIGVTGAFIQQFSKDFETLRFKNLVKDNGIEKKITEKKIKDDTLQYANEYNTGFYIETEIPVGLRSKLQVECKGHLRSKDTNEIKMYFVDKNLREDEDGKLKLRGIPCPEIYHINRDYLRLGDIKKYFPLSKTYDCCSDCGEKFPHRLVYSQQSFQEEATDNYKTFLANNYRDIQGEKGVITNIFKLNGKLFIHTEEGLWLLPASHQERVTDDIVTYIGTGSFFSTPPQLIIDSDNSSAGSVDKWATIKTRHGVFFISRIEEKAYFMKPQGGLTEASINGLKNFFENNVKTNTFLNTNTANPLSGGFIAAYDTRHDRILITKKSYENTFELTEDMVICEDKVIVFENLEQTLENYKKLGYEVKYDDCKYIFTKETETITTETIDNATDIHIFHDMSGSFKDFERQDIDSAVETWYANFKLNNPNFTGTLTTHYTTGDVSERWLNISGTIENHYSGNVEGKNIMVLSFINEANPKYHNDNPTINQPLLESDRKDFIKFYNKLNSFIGILYPIVNSEEATHFFLLQSSRVIGESLIPLLRNPAIPQLTWDHMLIVEYNTPEDPMPLRDYGWTGKWDKYRRTDGLILTPEEFENDITSIIESKTTETVTIDLEQEELIGIAVTDEEIIGQACDTSWTLSFHIETGTWISFHDYLPYYYITTTENFFSAYHKDNNVWRHNHENHFLTFQGKKSDFVIEYVTNKDPLQTKILEEITLDTEAKVYDEETQTWVEQEGVTFTDILAYNSKQSTGWLKLVSQDETDFYLDTQIGNTSEEIIISKEEHNWYINDLRDIVVNYSLPLFRKDCDSLKNEYYTDKIVNINAIDYDKNWEELEMLRDKYAIIRLKFSSFDDIQLSINYSIENNVPSVR